jgi:hypothetical protein
MLEKAKQNRVILSMDPRYVVRLVFFFYIENNVQVPQIFFFLHRKQCSSATNIF